MPRTAEARSLARVQVTIYKRFTSYSHRARLGSVRPRLVKLALVRAVCGAEAERVRLHHIDLHILESRGFEAGGECSGIDGHHRVEQVQQAEPPAVQTVCSRENAAGLEHSRYFFQE